MQEATLREKFDALKREIDEVYETIDSLHVSDRDSARQEWWMYLAQTCSHEAPCMECERDRLERILLQEGEGH